jgi:hypothetical protein
MKKWSIVLCIVIILLIVSGCSEPEGIDDEVAIRVAQTQTKQAWEASVASVQQTAEAEGSVAAEPSTTPEPGLPPEPTVTPEPEIIHVDIPGSPAEKINSFVTDFNSIDYAEDLYTYGDQFIINRYERPFTQGNGEYRGYLDIYRANLRFNPPWFYVEIFLAQPLPESSAALYGIELDLDIDGRGDYLILAGQPATEEWTVAGVTVLEDTNEDVGGVAPLLTEVLPEDWMGDGYDRVVFQEGLGDDPDLAWVRLNPDEPNSLEIAYKADLTGNLGYLWVIWADEGLRDPSLADYNDQFMFEEAGSPYPEHRYYPIQAIYQVDSTCRSWYGYDPVGDEIGICQIYEPGQGYKLCVTFNLGNTSFTTCGDVCAPECPAELPSGYFCEPCTIEE